MDQVTHRGVDVTGAVVPNQHDGPAKLLVSCIQQRGEAALPEPLPLALAAVVHQHPEDEPGAPARPVGIPGRPEIGPEPPARTVTQGVWSRRDQVRALSGRSTWPDSSAKRSRAPWTLTVYPAGPGLPDPGATASSSRSAAQRMGNCTVKLMHSHNASTWAPACAAATPTFPQLKPYLRLIRTPTDCGTQAASEDGKRPET